MKGIKIIAVLLTLALIVPIASSLLLLNGPIEYVGKINQTEEKEGTEKRESDSKDELDEVENYLLNHSYYSSLMINGISTFFNKGIGIPNFNTDVLNPPPESI